MLLENYIMESVNTNILNVKDILMVVSFVGGLLAIYIKHQIDFAKFKAEINIKVNMHEEKLKKIETIVEKQTEIQQELLLDTRESKTMLSNVIRLIDDLRIKVDTFLTK